MQVSLEVRYDQSSRDSVYQGYALTATVIEATNMSKAIFMFQRREGPDTLVGDGFVCIADPLDLEEVPENEPDLANEMPYYRKDSVTLYFRSSDLRNEARALMEADIASLCRSLQAMTEYAETETVVYTGADNDNPTI